MLISSRTISLLVGMILLASGWQTLSLECSSDVAPLASPVASVDDAPPPAGDASPLSAIDPLPQQQEATYYRILEVEHPQPLGIDEPAILYALDVEDESAAPAIADESPPSDSAPPSELAALDEAMPSGEQDLPSTAPTESLAESPEQSSGAGGSADPPTSPEAAVGLPSLLRLPAVGVEAAFEYVGLTPEGAMDVPKHPDNVAWYQLGATPGQAGNAMITGHVDWAGRVRALWYLNRLGSGDLVEIVDTNGRSYSFVIQWKRLYNAATAPVEVIYASSAVPEITLITCGGVFDQSTHQYLSRLVVRAALQ